MKTKNSYCTKTNFSKIALKNLNNLTLKKINGKASKNHSKNNANTLRKYDISEDQKYYFPYEKTHYFNHSIDPKYSRNFKTMSMRKDFTKKNSVTLNENNYQNCRQNQSRKKGKTTSEFFQQFEKIQHRFNTKNLNDFLRVYKSQEPRRRHGHKDDFRYDYDSLIGSFGAIDPKGEFKLDTAKNAINAPDPRSSFFRTRDNHFIRKNCNDFFIDERLRKRKQEKIKQNKLIKIINRENKMLEQKENQYRKNKRLLKIKRKSKLSKGNYC